MKSQTANIILLGVGKVGRVLIRQIESASDNLKKQGFSMQFIALADSQAAVCGKPLSKEMIERVLTAKETGSSLASLPNSTSLEQLTEFFNPETIVIDTTASKHTVIKEALNHGSYLVFANKNKHSAAWVEAKPFFNQSRVKYESTVGAGLPVIRTLQSLINTKDEVHRIQGVMSGTLGYLCSQLEAGLTYSQAVKQAYDLGYTEPDPRDDLSGFDVARKALILARTAGWPLEMSDLTVEAFYPAELSSLSISQFMDALPSLDVLYQEKVQQAALSGQVLRYLAEITPQGGMVGLTSVPKNSPLGALSGPGNYFSFTSKRYEDHPLIISGPGAGLEVTAAGVFSDLIDLLS